MKKVLLSLLLAASAVTVSFASHYEQANGEANGQANGQANGVPVSSVPDSGSTLLLLGMATAGMLVLAKKRFRK